MGEAFLLFVYRLSKKTPVPVFLYSPFSYFAESVISEFAESLFKSLLSDKTASYSWPVI